MTQYFSQQLSMDYLKDWAKRLQFGALLIAMLLLLMLTLTRHTRVSREIALRRAMGAGPGMAGWLSIKPTMGAILAGMACGCMLVLALSLALNSSLLPGLLPMFGAIGMIGAGAVVMLFGSALLAGRGQLITQLKGAW